VTTNLPAAELTRSDATRELLRRLELDITRRLDGLLQGDYRGLVPGQGSEPGETREYQAGDDVRRIDWNVTARLQKTHVRESIADRELETHVLVDLSPSLDFGTALREKRDLALIATAAVGFLTARTGNRFGAVLVTPDGAVGLPARQGRPHLLAICDRIATSPRASRGRTDLGAGLHRLARQARRRGLVVVISDFLADGWQHELRRLTLRHDVVAIELVDPRELELPDVGMLTVVDPESGRRREIPTGNAKFRARYGAAAAAQRDEIATFLRGSQIDHLVLRTDQDWLLELARFVGLRRSRIQATSRARGAS
jgi:uncharacterized protein (DUF58 family)